MKARYLVTAIGGDIGSSVIRHLGMELPVEDLLGCDITPYACGYGDAGEFFLAPPYADESRYVNAIRTECRRRGISHILPMTEGEIMLYDKYRRLFRSDGVKVMVHDSGLLATAMSKYRTAAAVKAMGLSSPDTWKPEEVTGKIPYPIVVKSDMGCGSRGVRVVRGDQEYRMALAEIPDPVVQEYVGTPEEEYTMGVFSNGTDTKSILFRRTLGAGGMTCRAELAEDEKASRIAQIAAQAFGLRGSINIQMRKQGGEYFIFEVNPRISSTVGFRHLLGFKDVLWWLDLLDGGDGAVHYAPPVLPAVGVRTFGEKIFHGHR